MPGRSASMPGASRWLSDSLPAAALGLAKYPSLFVGKYGQTYPHLCSHLRRQLRRAPYLDLNLDLYLDLNPSLYRTLFVRSYQLLFLQMFAALLGSTYRSTSE